MFPNNKKPKNCFLAACKIWDQNINQEIDQTENSPTENSILDFSLARSKVFRLHAILHDSAGAVKATTNHGTGYCYMLPQFPSSCLLDHITGLLFCVFITICHPRVFKMLDC